MRNLFYKIFLLLIIIVFSISTTISAQKTTDKQKINDVEKHIEESVNALDIPGVAFVLMKNGKTVYKSVSGNSYRQELKNETSLLFPLQFLWFLNSEEKKVDYNTPFLIGSISKTITAYAILQLAEKGHLSLEDPVQKHLSSIDFPKSKNKKELLISDLLTHQSGINQYIGMKYADLGLNHRNAIMQTIQKLFSEVDTIQPREKFEYSPINYLILAGVIESISGRAYADYLNQKIFQPLDMKSAAANQKESIQNGLIQGYQSWFGFSLPVSIPYDNSGASYGYISASINDMAKFVAELQEPEGSMPETKGRMLQPQIKTSQSTAYGLGTRFFSTDAFTLIGHSGSNANFRSEMWLIKDTDWGFVLLTNKNHALEESYLTQLSFDIAGILVGNNTNAPIEKSSPKGRWIFLGIVITLILLSIYWWYCLSIGRVKISSKWFWSITSIVLTLLTLILFPLLIKLIGFPWHTLWLFIPDITLTLLMLNIILFLNAFLSIRYCINLKNKPINA